MNLHLVSRPEFNQIDRTRQIIVHDHAQKFAILDLGENFGLYGISWYSDLVEPNIAYSHDDRSLWIGVDQRLVAINLISGRIGVAMSVFLPILQIIPHQNLTAILTEQEVLVFTANYCLKCFHFLPDLSQKISIFGDDFLIDMFDNSQFILKSNGLLKKYVDISSNKELTIVG